MKALAYDHNNKDVINILYTALLIGRPYRTPEARVVNKIKRTFEAQADVVKEELNGRRTVRFKIQCKPGEEKVLKLENAEFDLLKEVFMGIENWPGAQTEEVEQAEDYLNSIKDAEEV